MLFGKKIVYMVLCAMLFVISTFCNQLEAASHQILTSQELGRTLEEEFWTDVRNNDVTAITHQVSSIFQGLSADGFTNQSQEIINLIDLDLTSFLIHDLVATQQHDVLVVTYHLDSIIAGAPRFQRFVSVWKKVGKHSRGNCDCSPKKLRWKLVSQSFFDI